MSAIQSGRWARFSATLGAVAWVALTSLAGAGRARLGMIELLFLFAPLVVVPLGLELARKAVPSRSPGLEDAAQVLQPFAAALLVLSFWVPLGRTAALLALPWALFCLLTALCGAGLLLRREMSLPGIAAGMARADLAIAAGWLLSSRVGYHLSGFQEPIVLLTAVHFHYTGFATALMAAVALTFARQSGRVSRTLSASAALIVFVPFLLAAGFVFSPLLRVFAAVLLSLSVIALAVSIVALSSRMRNATAKAYVRLSAAASLAGMCLASIYAIGEVLGKDWLLIPRMASAHGLINALGFVLLGLLGWLVEWHAGSAAPLSTMSS